MYTKNDKERRMFGMNDKRGKNDREKVCEILYSGTRNISFYLKFFRFSFLLLLRQKKNIFILLSSCFIIRTFMRRKTFAALELFQIKYLTIRKCLFVTLHMNARRPFSLSFSPRSFFFVIREFEYFTKNNFTFFYFVPLIFSFG